MRARYLDIRGFGREAWREQVALRDRGVRPEVAVDQADRLHPLIPPETKRWRDLYRAAVERDFGRLKHDYGLAPLRVRGLE